MGDDLPAEDKRRLLTAAEIARALKRQYGIVAKGEPSVPQVEMTARPVDLLDPGGHMNKTEHAYAGRLEVLKRAGEIHDWRFAAVTLVLGPDCRYTPDFLVVENSGLVAFHEIKGFWRDDAKVKIRLAAKLFPWMTFTAFRRDKVTGWAGESFAP